MCFEFIMDVVACPLFIVATPIIGLYRILKSIFYTGPRYLFQRIRNPEVKIQPHQEPDLHVIISIISEDPVAP